MQSASMQTHAKQVAEEDDSIPLYNTIEGGFMLFNTSAASFELENYAITNDLNNLLHTVYFHPDEQSEQTKKTIIAMHSTAQENLHGVDLYPSMEMDHETGCCRFYVRPLKSGYTDGMCFCAKSGTFCMTPIVRFQAKPSTTAPSPLKEPVARELNAFLFSHRRVRSLTTYNITCLKGGAFAVPVNQMGTLAMLAEASYSRPTNTQWERAFPYLLNPLRQLSFTFAPTMTVFDFDGKQNWEELVARLKQLVTQFGGSNGKIYVSTRPTLRTTYHAYCTFGFRDPDVVRVLETGEMEGYEGWDSDKAIRRGAGRAVLSVPLLSEKIGKGSHEFVACVTSSGVQLINRLEDRQQHHAALTEVLSHVVDPSYTPIHIDTPEQTASKEVDKAILDCIAFTCNHANFKVEEVKKPRETYVDVVVSKGCWNRHDHKTNRCIYRFFIAEGHFSAKCYSSKCGGSPDLSLPPGVPRTYLQEVLEAYN